MDGLGFVLEGKLSDLGGFFWKMFFFGALCL